MLALVLALRLLEGSTGLGLTRGLRSTPGIPLLVFLLGPAPLVLTLTLARRPDGRHGAFRRSLGLVWSGGFTRLLSRSRFGWLLGSVRTGRSARLRYRPRFRGSLGLVRAGRPAWLGLSFRPGFLGSLRLFLTLGPTLLGLSLGPGFLGSLGLFLALRPALLFLGPGPGLLLLLRAPGFLFPLIMLRIDRSHGLQQQGKHAQIDKPKRCHGVTLREAGHTRSALVSAERARLLQPLHGRFSCQIVSVCNGVT